MKREIVLIAIGLGVSACAGEVVESEDVGALEAAVKSCKKEFVLTSPSFDDGDALPYENTCEGQAFSAGASPKLHWKEAPKGTRSYAIVLKDLSLVETLPNRAYHWVAWDIPSSVTSLPKALEAVQFPKKLKGGQQLSAFGAAPYAYFGPCPSWENLCSGGTAPRVTDSYALAVYAFDEETLELPPDDPAISNRARELAEYFESVAIDSAELTFTSDARPSSFPQVCPDAG
jgi:phosphatidylethanolamine-binding protein (PEBP) family uncharacterized protein